MTLENKKDFFLPDSNLTRATGKLKQWQNREIKAAGEKLGHQYSFIYSICTKCDEWQRHCAKYS